MQLANGPTSRLEHAETSSSNTGLIKRERKRETKKKNSTISSCTCPPQGYATNRTPRESTCAEDDDEEEQRACHRVTNIGCTRGGPDSAVSRWRWSLGGSGAGAGSRGYESGGWMDGRVVSYQGRAGSCGSTIPVKGGARAARGRDGSVVVLAWCYPHPPGVAVGWGDRYAVPSPVPHTTPRAHVHSASATT